MDTVWLDITHDNDTVIDAVVCLGYFDGLHRGHQTLVRRTLDEAQRLGTHSAILTFDRDPAEMTKGEHGIRHITPLREKLRLFECAGMEYAIILRFTQETAEMTCSDFLDFLNRNILVKAFVCGFDFRYGRYGQGDAYTLEREAGCPVYIMDSVDDDGNKISSTRIIKAISEGHIEEANRLLGRYYAVSGTVIHGRGKGHLIGFPTANIDIDGEYVRPAPGVYAGYIRIGEETYKTMMNIGHNPTFNYRSDLSVEAHILHFSADIYGREVTVELVKYLRPEKRFEFRDELVCQLIADRDRVDAEL